MTDKPATPAAETPAAPFPSSAPAGAASAAPAATPSASESSGSPPASTVAAPSSSSPSSDAAPAADGATKSESPPSLLASADAGKRDGAPKPDAAAKPADTPPPADAKAKPETGDGKAPEAKPEPGKDAAKDGADAAAKDALAQQPPAPPAYEAPKLPDGQKLDDKLLSAFDKKVGEFELAHKVDHTAMQSFRQEMINDYIAEVQRIGADVAKYQRDVWNRTIETRINELKADPELGGSRIETVLGNAKYVIEDFGGLSKAEQSELLAVWDNGGVSNHRLTVKLLNNIFTRFQPPQPISPNNPAASKLMSQSGKRNWYDTVDGAKSA
jgi:hypothetical protein